MNAEAVLTTTLTDQTKHPVVYKVLVVFAMMTLMGGSLTGVMTYINLGYTSSFLSDWLSAFLVTAVTVMPAGVLVMTLLTKAAEKLLPMLEENKRNLVVGVAMALIMESAMALSTALNNVGMATNSSELFTAWLNGVLAALPIALTLMVTVSMTIKPKIERFLRS
ncbi:DUF2798 domain-containing protein [Photobacterium sanguinicancri]|uniref:DUF2798 domain-containing protein n=1 Tax=Photobacterium sanguinicancri TaxID=875932 RepID=UPI002480946D|nr:DUF2798 domain-containing protein [Photobacterium sanguinicancri]